MNILYISNLDGRPWIGPTYSVPMQISAQSKYDNVFWYNIIGESGRPEGQTIINEWKQLNYYHDKSEFPSERIKDLPSPFNNPDIVVFEQCYPFAKSVIRKGLNKKYCYILIPRGEFTKKAQHKHTIKKMIGNIVLNYYGFLKQGIAIQCLTEDENRETDSKWNKKRIIIPNGTIIPDGIEIRRCKGTIECVSIGRLEPYQKGLDTLLHACGLIKEKLEEKHVHISLYGSDMEHNRPKLEEMITTFGLENIISLHEAVFQKDKDKVLRAADVFLMPSRFEGHPTGLLEALAYGLPCLVTTGSNMRKDIENADAGWGADNSVDSVRDALNLMIEDTDKFANKSINASELAKKYSWDAIAKHTHDEYEKLLGERNNG